MSALSARADPSDVPVFEFAIGSPNGRLEHPNNVAVDSSGNVYVTDAAFHRVQKFNSSGTYIASGVLMVLVLAN